MYHTFILVVQAGRRAGQCQVGVTMYTVSDVKAMTPEQTQKAFETVASRYYGTDRWKSAFANDVGLQTNTVQQWFTDRSMPPPWAFLLIQTWTELRRARDHLKSIISAIDYADDLD